MYKRQTQLTGTQIQTVEILQQVAQGGVLLFGFPKVYLRVEVDGPEYIAQLSTVVFLDICLLYTSLFDADYPYPKVYSDFCYQKSIWAILSEVLLEMGDWVA